MRPLLSFAAPAQQTPQPTHAFVEWRLPDNRLWCEIHRQQSHYLMRFPGLADFLISESGAAECRPVAGTSEPTLQHLFCNQVLPAVLSMLHLPVFHASCVEIEGAAIAFVGLSGRGKSTLATYLGLQGANLVTDDGLELAWHEDHYRVRPSQAAVRLWKDSRHALLPSSALPAPAVSYTTKQRFLGDGVIAASTSSPRLRRAYFLGEGTVTDISITTLTANQAHMAWVRHSFMLDAHDRARMMTHFQQVSRLVSQELAYTLDYPREYGLLPDVMSAIKAHLRATP